jgi:hypothetical protein
MSALLNAADKGRLLNFGGCSLTVITVLCIHTSFFSLTVVSIGKCLDPNIICIMSALLNAAERGRFSKSKKIEHKSRVNLGSLI